MKHFFVICLAILAISSLAKAQSKPKITQIGAGNSSICTLFDSGEITCMGSFTGVGSVNEVERVHLPAGRKATQIATGSSHLCALLDSGEIACWSFYYDRVGLRKYRERNYFLPNVLTFGNLRAKSITANGDLTCAIFVDGRGSCWGYIANRTFAPFPLLKTPDDLTFKQIAIGYGQICAILSDSKVYCWGGNSYGQLGYKRSQENSPDFEPVITAPVSLGEEFTPIDLTAGFGFSCALLAPKSNADQTSVKCWGINFSGSLGTGVASDIPTEMDLKNLKAVKLPPTFRPIRIFSNSTRACALNKLGILICWGQNNVFLSSPESDDVIGDSLQDLGEAMVPFHFGNLERVKEIAQSPSFNCVLLKSGKVKCWGSLYFSTLSQYSISREAEDFASAISRFPPLESILAKALPDKLLSQAILVDLKNYKTKKK
jgi:alpha-tubulin suppressor-like RCC1 family protein